MQQVSNFFQVVGLDDTFIIALSIGMQTAP